ncbi:Manganese/iron superoxide dismutase [Cytidiella melzeri]|nr:Manganese/iron superoxide dismutase [Cytidiella melzeri]
MRVTGARRVIAPAFRVSVQRIQSRQAHNRLQLPYKAQDGLGEFLPPQALKVVAEEYQQGLLDRLNEHVVGTAMHNLSVAQTVIQSARDPQQIIIFNYASEALNNSFFLSCLRPVPEDKASHEDAISPDLAQAINSDFGNLEQLKSTFSAAVVAMRCQGYVWLLVDKRGHLAVYPTFGNGTLLIHGGDFLPAKAGVNLSSTVIGEEPHGLGNYRLKSDAGGPSSPASGFSLNPTSFHPPRQTRSYTPFKVASVHGESRGSDVTAMTDKLYPLFCVSVHEHAWMSAGYGVWGKEEWMKKFWAVVNWEQASVHFTRYTASAR